MVNLLKPTGQSKSSFNFNEGGMGQTVLEAMLNAKAPVKDLGVHRHKYVSSGGIGTLCNNRGFAARHEFHLPHPKDKEKIFSITIPKLEKKGKLVNINFGTYANALERRRLSTGMQAIEFNGLDKKERPNKLTMSVALTDDNAFVLMRLSGPGLNGKPAFTAFYSIVYDFETKKANKGIRFIDPLYIVGSKLSDPYHVDYTNDNLLNHSPFWDKDKGNWILALNSPAAPQRAEVVTYDPLTKVKEVKRTGKVYSKLAMLTTDYELVNDVGGLSQVGKGTRRAPLNNRIYGPGGLGGFGKVSTVGSITVVTNDYNYFAALDSTGSNYTAAAYGAVDYYEEVTFRKEVARYFGL